MASAPSCGPTLHTDCDLASGDTAWPRWLTRDDPELTAARGGLGRHVRGNGQRPRPYLGKGTHQVRYRGPGRCATADPGGADAAGTGGADPGCGLSTTRDWPPHARGRTLAPMNEFTVECAAGSLRPHESAAVTHFAHRWTDKGVDVTAGFTGADLLHAAVAACVLNDIYREADQRGIALSGVRVRAAGGFTAEWASTGIGYEVEVDSPADPSEIEELIMRVDGLAEIPRAVRAGAPVGRVR